MEFLNETKVYIVWDDSCDGEAMLGGNGLSERTLWMTQGGPSWEDQVEEAHMGTDINDDYAAFKRQATEDWEVLSFTLPQSGVRDRNKVSEKRYVWP